MMTTQVSKDWKYFHKNINGVSNSVAYFKHEVKMTHVYVSIIYNRKIKLSMLSSFADTADHVITWSVAPVVWYTIEDHFDPL